MSPTQRAWTARYLEACFEPFLAPQPYRYSADFTRRLAELTMRAKRELAVDAVRSGWRGPTRGGIVMLSRLLFGTNSLLAELGSECDWRALLQSIETIGGTGAPAE